MILVGIRGARGYLEVSKKENGQKDWNVERKRERERRELHSLLFFSPFRPLSDEDEDRAGKRT